jgi:hypothetical protein
MTWGMSGAQVHDEGLMSYAHRGNDTSERSRAVRAVASLAVDAGDCAYLLEVLGLNAAEGKEITT